MFQFIWQIYTTGIVIFFLVFLLLEDKPFGPRIDKRDLLALRHL